MRNERRERWKHRRLRTDGGITLLEMLAVVATLALLATLLLPILTRTQRERRQNLCLANLRRLSSAVRMYARDYNDHPVPATIDWKRVVPGQTWYQTNVYWPVQLRPYIGGTDAFWCPDAPFPRPSWGPGVEWKTYAINAHVAARIPWRPDAPLRPLAAVARPEEVGLLVDGAGVCYLHSEGFIEPPDTGHSGYARRMRTTYPNHRKGVNLAYVDGHVEWMPTHAYVGNPAVGSRLWGQPHKP